MAKILESLPLTIAAGVVITIVMIIATDAIYDSQMSEPEKAAREMMNNM